MGLLVYDPDCIRDNNSLESIQAGVLGGPKLFSPDLSSILPVLELWEIVLKLINIIKVIKKIKKLP